MARLKKTVVFTAGLLACSVALADPFSLIATAVVYGAGLTGAAAFATFAVASLLGNATARRKQKKAAAAAKSAYNASLTDRTVTILNTEMPHRIVYGNPAPFAGAVVADMISGDRDQFHHMIYVFAACSLTAIDDIFIDGVSVGNLDGSGWADGSEFSDTTITVATQNVAFDGSSNAVLTDTKVVRMLAATLNPDTDLQTEYEVNFSYDAGTGDTTLTAVSIASSTLRLSYEVETSNPRLNIQKHLSPGGVDTADAFFISQVPAKWTSAHKLSGYSYLAVTTDLTLPRFQSGPPNITIKARGKAVYDPRTTLTAYSANPILCRSDFIMSQYGWGASIAQIEASSWIASANACDVAAYTASDQTGNTTVLYSCDGVFDTAQDRDVTLQLLEDCCAGNTHESGGVWRLMAGFWEAPVMALTDDDLHGPLVVQQASYTSKERFNGVRGQYCDWRNNGAAGDFTPYVNSTFLSDDGTARNDDMSLPFTHSHQRAIQLARVRVEKSRGGLVISYPAHMRAWPLQPGDRVTVTNAEYAFSAKNFRVSDWMFNLQSPVGLELIEDEESFYDLADEATVDAAPNTDLPDPFAKPDAPTGLTVESGTDQLVLQGSTVIVRGYVTWNQSTNQFVREGTVQVRWVASSDLSLNWQPLDLPGDASSVYLYGLPDGQNVLIQARFISSVNVASDWTTIAHNVIGKTAAPSNVANLTINGDILAWPAISDIDLAGYVFRFHYGQNTDWGSAAPLHTGFITESPYALTSRPGGPVTIMVKAVDTTGNLSAVSANVFTDLGDAPVANVVEVIDFEAIGWTGTIEGGAIVGDDIEADALDSFYGTDNQSFYGADTAPFYEPSAFGQLIYTTDEVVISSALNGSILTLEIDYDGADLTIEYRLAGPGTFYGADADSFYGPDAEPFYGDGPSDWFPWPGQLTAQNSVYQFRVTIGAGPEQGVIREMTLTIDAPDIEEDIQDVPIDIGGTAIPYIKNFTVIKTIVPGLQAALSGAIGIDLDKTTNLAPIAFAVDGSGTPVAGATSDFRLKGY